VGFEPTIRLPVCRISSAVPSTARPPLQTIDVLNVFVIFKDKKIAICYRFGTQRLFGALLCTAARSASWHELLRVRNHFGADSPALDWSPLQGNINLAVRW
jgi:hypothetical protein